MGCALWLFLAGKLINVSFKQTISVAKDNQDKFLKNVWCCLGGGVLQDTLA